MDTQLKELQQAIREATAGLSAEQLSWRPPGKWCAAEVLEHLYLTYTGTIKGFERMAAAGKPPDAARTWAQRRTKWVVLGLSYLPSGREAPPFARPRGLPAEKVLAEIGQRIAEMDAVIAQWEQKLGRGKLLNHTLMGPLSGAEWRRFHLVHGRHHLKQIRDLRRQMGG